jgi:UDP-N-acetyl-D-galactosamine dehydrogenase
VNIALINELSIIFGRMDIDTHEVLDAASTKWNFINMRPGLVGGHCIGVDPYYLTYKAAQVGHESDLILTARNINNSMASYVAANTIKHILKGGKSVTGARVLVMGFAFKENCTDIRNTKVSQIIADLHSNGLVVDVFDPWVDFTDCEDLSHCEIIRDPLQSKNKYDAIIVAVAHDAFKAYTARDYEEMSNGEKIVIDVKNIVAAPTWRL